MIQFPKPYADAVARLRVPSGFLIVLVFAWLSRPSPVSIVWGVPVSLLGLALRGWAAGCLDKNRQLSTGGPYAHTRNPLYLGTLAAAAGLAIAAPAAVIDPVTREHLSEDVGELETELQDAGSSVTDGQSAH